MVTINFIYFVYITDTGLIFFVFFFDLSMQREVVNMVIQVINTYLPGYIQQDDMLLVIICSIRHFYPIQYPSIRNLDLPFERLLDHIHDVCVTQGTLEPLSDEILQSFYHNDPLIAVPAMTIRAVRMEERS